MMTTSVERGDRLAEWDPSYKRPILTEVDGVIQFDDLVEGISMDEQMDEQTGNTNRVIKDWRMSSPKGVDLKPRISSPWMEMVSPITLDRGGEAHYILAPKAICVGGSGAERSKLEMWLPV